MAGGRTSEADAVPAGPGQARTPRWVRGLVAVGAGLVAVAALVTWLLGGFEVRRDYAVAQPGEEVDAGNLVFALTDATAQQDASGNWTVIVHGMVRNPHDEALAPVYGDAGNLAVSRASGTQSAVLSSVELGGTWQRNLVPPGNHPVELAAGFTFPAGVEFGETIRCGVFAFEYTDNSVLGVSGGEKAWNPDSTVQGTAVTVPLRILPPED